MIASGTHAARAWIVITCALVLVACQAITPPQPKTPTEALAVVYSGISAAAVTATDRLNAGGITVDQAERVLVVLENARAVADTGRAALSAGDAPKERTP